MKKICRLGTLLIVLTILFGIGGAFANNDDDFSDRFSYCRMPLTLKPEKTTVNAGDKIQVEYSVSRNTADGLTWCGDIRGYYEWVYINEYKNANGETIRWETTVNQEDERSIDSDSGTITLASIRSDFSQIELRMRVFATNNDNIYISSWDEAAHKSIIYYDEQIVSITISDAKPRENVTCDFTLASDKVEYGEEFTVQYKIRGLEDLDPEDIISTDHTVVQLTEAASEHGETGVLHNEGTLTGTVTGTAIDAYFFRVDVSVAWTDGGDTLYRDFKSPVIAVQRAYLGMTGWIEKDGKWYYGDENGYALVGRHLIGENSWTGFFYYFDKKGVLQTGWFPYKDSMGYADADGHMRIGLDLGNPIPHGTHLQQVDGDWYYFDGDGSIVTNMVVWDNYYKNRYYMDSSGKGIPLLNITEKEKVTGVYQVKEGKWKSSSVILNADGTAKLYFYNNDLDTYQKDTYQWIIRNGGVVLKDSSFGEYTEECAIRFDETGTLHIIMMGNHAYPVGGYTDLYPDGKYKTLVFSPVETQNGWIEADGGWLYYMDGEPVEGWQDIEGKRYYFTSEGVMKTGWLQDGSEWYFFTSDGAMVTGWQRDSGAWYYLKPSGEMATGWQNDGGVWYYLKPSGEMATGWISYGGAWYYLKTSGAMATGWISDGGAWYYLKPSGAMATGWISDSGAWYYLKPSGAMTTGWVSDNGAWYYMSSGGALYTGWLQDGNAWYYFDANGAMVTGVREIDGTEYIFDANGAWQENATPVQTGWVQDGGSYYYYDESSIMVTGWQSISGSWYHFSDSGKMTTGWFEDKEAEANLPAEKKHALWYWFDQSGAMAIGWKEINGQWELFDDSGKWLYTWDGQ